MNDFATTPPASGNPMGVEPQEGTEKPSVTISGEEGAYGVVDNLTGKGRDAETAEEACAIAIAMLRGETEEDPGMGAARRGYNKRAQPPMSSRPNVGAVFGEE